MRRKSARAQNTCKKTAGSLPHKGRDGGSDGLLPSPQTVPQCPQAGRSPAPVPTGPGERSCTHPFIAALRPPSATQPTASFTSAAESTSLSSTSPLLNLVNVRQSTRRVLGLGRAMVTRTRSTSTSASFINGATKSTASLTGLGWDDPSSHTPQLQGQSAEGLYTKPSLLGAGGGGTTHPPPPARRAALQPNPQTAGTTRNSGCVGATLPPAPQRPGP